MSRGLGAVGHIEGGYDTARVPTAATAADQAILAERNADALAYLTRRDALDIAEILGLVEPAPRKRGDHRLTAVACPQCETTFLPSNAAQRCCSRRCAGAYLVAQRRAAEEVTTG